VLAADAVPERRHARTPVRAQQGAVASHPFSAVRNGTAVGAMPVAAQAQHTPPGCTGSSSVSTSRSESSLSGWKLLALPPPCMLQEPSAGRAASLGPPCIAHPPSVAPMPPPLPPPLLPALLGQNGRAPLGAPGGGAAAGCAGAWCCCGCLASPATVLGVPGLLVLSVTTATVSLLCASPPICSRSMRFCRASHVACSSGGTVSCVCARV
jgi:hypothetical protein